MEFNGKTLDVPMLAARLRKIEPTADIEKEFKSAIDSYVLKREGIYAMATMNTGNILMNADALTAVQWTLCLMGWNHEKVQLHMKETHFAPVMANSQEDAKRNSTKTQLKISVARIPL